MTKMVRSYPQTARHADGSLCERAVTTHDCPQNHEYELIKVPVETINGADSERETVILVQYCTPATCTDPRCPNYTERATSGPTYTCSRCGANVGRLNSQGLPFTRHLCNTPRYSLSRADNRACACDPKDGHDHGPSY
jgi:hypothetical protein